MRPRSVFIIPIHGTWSLNQVHPWWKKNSDFEQFAKRNNVHFKEVNDEPFIWNDRIDGISWKSIFGIKDRHDDWRTAGFALRYYLQRVRLEDRNLILHSHAWPVYLYSNMQVNNVITVGSPMRADLKPLAEKAKYNYHLHIYDQVFDKIAYLGQLGDGKFLGSRSCDTANENCKLEHIGHSKILTDLEAMQYWVSKGWFDVLRKDNDRF